ncbi:ABC transporter permease [Paenibacillus sp. URB8-2]|uniref:ABC transporter permease n=1 Tax=Paenibacillus sp. URB8-2 TaxID=2741301 RepID=UPI0015C26461|nr:ABC transporter permease [Paenibacillus sp. URB8-2]
MLPILFVLLSIFNPPNDNWVQIRQYLVKDYIAQTVQLTLTVAVLTALLGVTLAWLTAVFDFPGKRFFRWALILPLAIPPYIAAFTYSTMFSYTGVVQTTLRNRFGIVPNQELITVSSMRGAVLVFTLFLFPYVYLITKSFLERQSASYIENARLLGRNGLSIFLRIALPLSRPAIAGSISLVIFEVLSDYGVTSYFGIQTVSTAIFQTWFGMYDADSAMRLAAWLMIIVIGLFLVEMLLRKRRAYSSTTSKSRPLVPRRLTGIRGWAASLFCMVVWCAAFLFPLLQLIVWAGWTFDSMWNAGLFQLIYQTLFVAVVSTLIIMIFSLIAATANRTRSTSSFVLSKAITAGYSMPGAIIAIGVLVVFLKLDKVWTAFHHQLTLGGIPLVLSLTLAMLIAGYVIRFMATGYNSVEVGFEKMGRKYTEASRMLGHGITATFFKVDLPLIKGAVMSGCLLTFVEICKELPLALILRPFNFETLATKAYRYASDEQIFEAAIPSLLIIGISLISVYVMHYLDRKWEK